MREDIDKNKNKADFPIIGTGESCDCNSDNCCPTDSRSSDKSHRGIRTLIFVIVMLAAVAVGAYSLIDNQTDTEDSFSVTGFDPGFDLLQARQSAYASELLGDAGFIYITLAGAGAATDYNSRTEALVEDAASLVRKRDITVKTLTVKPGDSAFSQAVDLFGVTNLPAVLAIKKDGESVLVQNEITENNLLKAFLMASDPSECAPGCDPKDCQ